MRYKIGSGFIGTDDIKTSTAMQDIIPDPPEGWTMRYSLYKFSFLNKQPCHVVVNGKTRLYLDTDQGFDTNERDALITSFVIEESGIEYQFIGAY